MKPAIAAAVITCAVGLAGCATPASQLDSKQTAAGAATSKDKLYFTGSRLPENPPRDRSLRRIEGQEWVEQDRSRIITQQPTNVR